MRVNVSKTEPLTVALVQRSCQEDVQANLHACVAGIIEAAKQGAQLVLLQELHNSRYFCQSEDTRNFALAETIPGPTTEILGQVAREHNIVIVASLFEKRASGLYHNTAVVIETDGSIAGKYRKMHIPDDPGYYEKFYFTPGDLGFTPIQTSVGRLGVLVCWDQWYPEAARLMSLAGAQLLLYPTAIGWEPADDEAEKTRQTEAWKTIQRAHAIANNLPVLSCNRVGFEPAKQDQQDGIQFWGSSFVCGPQGELVAEAHYNKECVLVADLYLERCEALRQIWPFLRDRRIDAYNDLLLRYRDD
jgi:N-carbamoylputrescine amidase